MGQADTLARCKLASFSPDLVMIATFFDIWNHDHLHHLHHQDHLDQMCERLFDFCRCVNDCLRVSEEKEVVSDGAAGGSRFVDDDCDEDGLTMFE